MTGSTSGTMDAGATVVVVVLVLVVDVVVMGVVGGEQVDGDLVDDEGIQIQAGANDFEKFNVGLEDAWQAKLVGRQAVNDELVFTCSTIRR